MKRGGILALVGLGLGGAYLWSRKNSTATTGAGTTGTNGSTGTGGGGGGGAPAQAGENFLLFLALCQKPKNLNSEQQEALIEVARPYVREELGSQDPGSVDTDQLSAILGNVAFKLVAGCPNNAQAYDTAKVLANQAWLRETGGYQGV